MRVCGTFKLRSVGFQLPSIKHLRIMERWIGKLAVVTGASAGIGAEIVRDFAKSGIHVVGLARRPEKIEQIASELGETPGKIHAHVCDVSDLQSIKETFKWISDTFGSIQILVNNAGIGKRKVILSAEPSEDDDDNVFDKVIATNFNGLVNVTRAAFRLMVKNDDYGMIVNINSVAGHCVPFPSNGEAIANVYHGTKHAVTATTEILVIRTNFYIETRFYFYLYSVRNWFA